MDPELLELEVTESTIMHNAERAVRVLTAIKELGVRLAIDDFGTGYSSLAHLKRFPIDTLKVDRSFIREVPNDAEDKAIAEAIIAMGKTLSLTVVAEGVETPEQQAFLSDTAVRRDAGLLLQHAGRGAGFRRAAARALAETAALTRRGRARQSTLDRASGRGTARNAAARLAGRRSAGRAARD